MLRTIKILKLQELIMMSQRKFKKLHFMIWMLKDVVSDTTNVSLFDSFLTVIADFKQKDNQL